MSEFKKYIITWSEDHKKEVLATSEDGALIDVMIDAGESITCTKSKDFKIIDN